MWGDFREFNEKASIYKKSYLYYTLYVTTEFRVHDEKAPCLT